MTNPMEAVLLGAGGARLDPMRDGPAAALRIGEDLATIAI